MSILHAKGHTIECHTEMIEATPIQEPDPAWQYIDRKGHTHKWEKPYAIHTIIMVVDAEETDEYPAVTHYECRKCKERIMPGMRSPGTRQYITGLTHWSIDGEPSTEEEAKALMAHITKAPL